LAELLTPDLCVIGAGAAGVSVAAAAATLGVPVVLIEKGRFGGESLHTGSVPSKAMIAAAKRAGAFRNTAPFGVISNQPAVEFAEVNDHIHRVIGAIAPNASRERVIGLGVRVIDGEATFRDPRTVVVGPEDDIRYEIKARRFVIATGSRPVIPAVSGLDQVAYLTNENAFELRERPRHLIVLGAGRVGLELAQAFRRLGSEVTVLDTAEPLSDEDPECAAILLDAFAREGITVRGHVKVERMRRLRQRVEVVLAGTSEETIHGSDVLVAVGRRPNIDALNLPAARIKHQPDGVVVNKRLRTSNRRVYAIGDVTGQPHFTHSAIHQASLLIRHLLFRLPIKLTPEEIPRVTFTDPELVHVGLSDPQARQQHGSIRLLRWPYRDNDRAQAERQARGHIKVITNVNGLILGVTIVGAGAAEQIATWTLAINHGLNIRAMADLVVPYPTYTEVSKLAAVSFFTPRLRTNWIRRILRLLRWFG